MWRRDRRRLSKNMNKILFTIHKALNPVSNQLVDESNREGLWWTLPQQFLSILVVIKKEREKHNHRIFTLESPKNQNQKEQANRWATRSLRIPLYRATLFVGISPFFISSLKLFWTFFDLEIRFLNSCPSLHDSTTSSAKCTRFIFFFLLFFPAAQETHKPTTTVSAKHTSAKTKRQVFGRVFVNVLAWRNRGRRDLPLDMQDRRTGDEEGGIW